MGLHISPVAALDLVPEVDDPNWLALTDDEVLDLLMCVQNEPHLSGVAFRLQMMIKLDPVKLSVVH